MDSYASKAGLLPRPFLLSPTHLYQLPPLASSAAVQSLPILTPMSQFKKPMNFC